VLIGFSDLAGRRAGDAVVPVAFRQHQHGCVGMATPMPVRRAGR
jgi:hypothetical protein